MNALCLICREPNKIWCKFLNSFSHYHIFMVVDYTVDCTDLKKEYTNITFFQIDEDMCTLSGYVNMNLLFSNKLISGWDKAVYYFCKVIQNRYEYVWFVEDDVYFYDETTLLRIDERYHDHDLLSNKFTENVNGKTDIWHWKKIEMNYSPPFYKAMVCVIRVSKRMLDTVNEYAQQNNTLFFLEALFPTLAIKNGLSNHQPEEFRYITWKDIHDDTTLLKTHLYHPFKNIEDHVVFREK